MKLRRSCENRFRLNFQNRKRASFLAYGTLRVDLSISKHERSKAFSDTTVHSLRNFDSISRPKTFRKSPHRSQYHVHVRVSKLKDQLYLESLLGASFKIQCV